MQWFSGLNFFTKRLCQCGRTRNLCVSFSPPQAIRSSDKAVVLACNELTDQKHVASSQLQLGLGGSESQEVDSRGRQCAHYHLNMVAGSSRGEGGMNDLESLWPINLRAKVLDDKGIYLLPIPFLKGVAITIRRTWT